MYYLHLNLKLFLDYTVSMMYWQMRCRRHWQHTVPRVAHWSSVTWTFWPLSRSVPSPLDTSCTLCRWKTTWNPRTHQEKRGRSHWVGAGRRWRWSIRYGRFEPWHWPGANASDWGGGRGEGDEGDVWLWEVEWVEVGEVEEGCTGKTFGFPALVFVGWSQLGGREIPGWWLLTKFTVDLVDLNGWFSRYLLGSSNKNQAGNPKVFPVVGEVDFSPHFCYGLVDT